MPHSRYSTVAIVFHWTIAVLLIANLAAGLAFDRIEAADKQLFFTLIQLHKSTGITILVLAVARLIWRLMNPPPPLPDHMTSAERVLATISHWGFYVLMFALPLSGWAMVSTGKLIFPMFWYGLFEIPKLPIGNTQHETFENVHGLLGWVVLALIVLHVAAALKHHYFDRDNLLARMWPSRGKA
ncbi:cytochrome b [Sphingosinicellaceae bacterium]|nr:cytochrome b [Sphingosinicellaceae bacterium]